jgi:hypothetical protein
MKLVVKSLVILSMALGGAACSSDEGGSAATTTTGSGDGTTSTTTTGTGDADGDPGTTDTTTDAGATTTDAGAGTTTTTDAGGGTTTTDGGGQTTTDTGTPDGTTDDGGTDGEDPNFPAGTNHPCQENQLPGSNDSEVEACVCEADPYCCDNVWDFLCVQKVQDECDVSCACEALPQDVTACTEDADCGFCDDSDMCNGVWSCTDGQCAASAPVVCDASGDNGCAKNTCNPSDGTCAVVADDDICQDEDPCTADSCDADTGSCVNEEIEGCGENHPCKSAATPGSADDAITTCVCEQDSYCCNFAWDSTCVTTAKEECSLTCDCTAFTPEDLACESDFDCNFCDDDSNKCNGTWVCSEGAVCVAAEAVVCDASANAGCVVNTCNEASGECQLTGDDAQCDDENPNTYDFCDEETQSCLAQELTCDGKCGEYDADAPCQCDTSCFQFDDCCTDVCDNCAAEPDYVELCVDPGNG